MTPLQELQAAHIRLKKLRESGSPGPWVVGDRAPDGWNREDLQVVASVDDGDVTDYIDNNDMHLIVTLHRTIDAQLAVLADRSLDVVSYQVQSDSPVLLKVRTVNAGVLSLARAINAEAT